MQGRRNRADGAFPLIIWSSKKNTFESWFRGVKPRKQGENGARVDQNQGDNVFMFIFRRTCAPLKMLGDLGAPSHWNAYYGPDMYGKYYMHIKECADMYILCDVTEHAYRSSTG